MGIVGSIIIGRWSYGLIRGTSHILLDGDVEPDIAERIRHTVEQHEDDRVTDLHLWRVGPENLSAIVCIATHDPRPPDHYKRLLLASADITHVTVEVNPCPCSSQTPA